MDTEDRIDLLLRLTSADVERRLTNEVLKSITAEERRSLTVAVVARADRLIADGAIDDELRRLVREWTAKEAVTAANARWLSVKGDIVAKVNVLIEAHTTPEKVAAIVDTIVPNSMRAAVVDRVNEVLKAIKMASREAR